MILREDKEAGAAPDPDAARSPSSPRDEEQDAVPFRASKVDVFAFSLGSSVTTTPVGRIGAIALYTFKEAIRQKILYALALFAVAVMAFALVLGQLSAGQEEKVLIDVGLSAMRLFGFLIAAFLGVDVAARDRGRHILLALMTKPVRRSEYILGKFLGGGLTLLVGLAFMGVGVEVALAHATGGMRLHHARLLPAVYLIYLELLLMGSLALICATFASATMTAVITVLLFIAGHLSADLLNLAGAASSSAMAAIYRCLYYGLPNLENFNVILPVAHGRVVPLSLVGKVSAYAALYMAIVLIAAMNIFERRDLR